MNYQIMADFKDVSDQNDCHDYKFCLKSEKSCTTYYNSLGKIAIRLNNSTLILGPRAYLVPFGSTCFFIITGHPRDSNINNNGENVFLFGKEFLRFFYTMYDYDS